ncbi:zona pellucida sperm-binding protein 3 receptor-like [Eschrichtius robustus]|uniref:zona pellucida sperm-binding protein 3 receptor-like n=1 Tax=Eschrichtius robustus TaxID=9764 RepID=UPI0035BF391C
MCPPRVPHGALDTKGKMRARPSSGPWRVSDPTLFQMTLVAALLATVLGNCGPPPYLPFASPIKKLYDTDFKTGTTLRYTCHLGYSKISSSSVTCNDRGSWDYSAFCAKKRCRNLEDLPNGKVEVKTDFLFGSTVEFSCSEGYILVGSTTSHCEIQGRGVDWSDPLPQCIIAKCEPPPAISNGKHNGGDEDLYTYGSSVTYSCDPGFSMLGKASISCTVENKTIGVWNPSPPTCKNVVCHRPQVPNGIIVSGFGPTYNYKNFLVFSCKKGYVLKGSHLIRCEANNKWHPSPPVCELNSCIGLPDIPHAVWNRRGYELSNQEVFAVGTALKYQCKHGYRPIPDEPLTVTCQENFTWTPSEGCERVCCPAPELETMRITSERTDFPDRCEYAYGHSVSYTCDEGYYPVSPDGMSSCQADGTWKPEMPACKQDCDSPPVIAHGHHKLISSFLGLKSGDAIYECDEGYTLVGKNKLSCTSSGWSPAAPQCKALCLKPEIEHGRLSVDKDGYVEPEDVTVQCDSGYGLVGSQSITCSEDRTWYPEVPKCEWEYPEGCEQVVKGKKLMQWLPTPEEVRLALEVYKLYLEIQQLELQNDKAKQATQECSL